MNITFLMGNGFDIGLGLKTSYEDFYPHYCEVQPTDNDNIQAFKKLLRNRNLGEVKNIINWADFEKAFGQHSSSFKIEEKDAYMERFEDFVRQFNAYLEDEEKRVDYSKEAEITRIMKQAITTYYQLRPAEQEAIQHLYNSITSTRYYNFISFNYTKTVDKCAKLLKNDLDKTSSLSLGKVLHIHGYIEENMIMGVNDPSQITNPAFASDTDIALELIKPEQNLDARTNYERQVIDVLNDSNIICIYGMSLGETDAKWWQHIAGWLEKDRQNKLVILSYKKNYTKRFTFDQHKSRAPILTQFLSYTNRTDEVKDKIRKQIVVGINHLVFSMDLCHNDADHALSEPPAGTVALST